MDEAVALGLGNNVDYEIGWDSEIIESLIRNYDISQHDLYPVEHIKTMRDLIISILASMRSGTGAERYVENSALITEFAGKFSKEITIGGTAARAAIAMGRIGVPSSVHLVTMNEHVRRLLPADGSRFCSNSADSLYPHLIVQYEKGTHVAAGDIDVTVPVSTRLIYVNDHDNTVMKLEREFFDHARNANVCLISGFNAMHDRSLLRQRLHELGELLTTFPDVVTVFYEDACFHNADFRHLVLEDLSSLLDVFSLNEEEMQGYLREKMEPLDPGRMLESVRALHAVIPVSVLVIHTRYWALATGPDCDRFAGALKHGIAMAATRFRLGDHFSKADFLAALDLRAEGKGAAFAKEINRLGKSDVCCLPCAEVEEKKVTTIGLGDAFVGGFLSTLAGVQI
jgi:ADP-dependent phosphofructokinase/glucokinase